MISGGVSHLAPAIDRLRDEVDVRHPPPAGRRHADGTAAATASIAEVLERLAGALDVPGDPARDETLALLERAEHLEDRLLRAMRETAAARREHLDRGLVEIRACETPEALLDRLCSIAVRALDAGRVVVRLLRDDRWSGSRVATAGPTDPADVSPGFETADLSDAELRAVVSGAGRAVAVGGEEASVPAVAAVAAPIPVAGTTVALLHVEADHRELDVDDLAYAERLGRVAGETFELLDVGERLAAITRTVERSIGDLRLRIAEQPAAGPALRPSAFPSPPAPDPPRIDPGPAARLTARQRETLGLMVRGLSNAEIAEALVISIPTVKGHVSAIFRAIGAVNRAEAITRYLDEGADA